MSSETFHICFLSTALANLTSCSGFPGLSRAIDINCKSNKHFQHETKKKKPSPSSRVTFNKLSINNTCLWETTQQATNYKLHFVSITGRGKPTTSDPHLNDSGDDMCAQRAD